MERAKRIIVKLYRPANLRVEFDTKDRFRKMALNFRESDQQLMIRMMDFCDKNGFEKLNEQLRSQGRLK